MRSEFLLQPGDILTLKASLFRGFRGFTLYIAGFREILRRDPLIGFEVMTELTQSYFNRLNSTRPAINNLFKIFKFQTGKARFFDTYGELK